MMTIGQLATAAGISTRTVRHYHRLGLLPERSRRSNGYREYDIKDLLMLLRVRRLTGLGLSLADCAAALNSADDQDLRDLLLELDQELSVQERAIRQRREAIGHILAGRSHPAVSAEVADLVDQLRVSVGHIESVGDLISAGEVGAVGGTSDHPAAGTGLFTLNNIDALESAFGKHGGVPTDEQAIAAEAHMLEMLQVALPHDQFTAMAERYRELMTDREALADGMELNRQFAELAEIDQGRGSAVGEYSTADLARIAALAGEMSKIARTFFAVHSAPTTSLAAGQDTPPYLGSVAQNAAWAGFGAALSPAQLMCVELAEREISS